jgi:4-hydroxybenzoate polyprenyltransferase
MLLAIKYGGFFTRIGIYLKEMYPIPQRLIYSTLMYLSFAILASKNQSVTLDLSSPIHLIGIINVFTILLILRLMDELKDKDLDEDLFSERPLPSGRVRESDISFSLIALIVLFITINVFSWATLLAALMVLCYTLLMFRYFFIPKILRKYLLLNLATHNPIIPVIIIFLLIMFGAQNDLPLSRLLNQYSILLVVWFWSLLFSWEITRKIKSPEEENEYVTYSQIFGYIGAVIIAAVVQTLTFIISIYFFLIFNLSWFYLLTVTFAYIIVISGHVRFIHIPNPSTSKLKYFTEAYILTLFLAVIIDYVFINLLGN